MWRVLLCACFVSGCLAAPEGWRGSNHLLLGGKVLSSDFEPADSQVALGYEYNARKHGFGFEAGANYGYDRGTDAGASTKSETLEAFAGPRYTWDVGRWHPFISLGLSFVYADVKFVGDGAEPVTDSGTALGGYGATGFDVDLGRSVMLGLGLRHTFLQDVGGSTGDADAAAFQAYLRLGYSF